MPGQYLPKWKPSELAVSAQGWNARLEWTCIGAADQTDAIANAPVRINSQHPSNPLLKCMAIGATNPLDPNVFDINATYAMTAGGGDHPDPAANPLLAPWKVLWEPAEISEQYDRDTYGNPLLNAALVPFDQLQERRSRARHLTIKRNEPFYSDVKAAFFEDKLNLDSLVLTQPDGRAVTYTPGAIRVLSIMPVGDVLHCL